MKNVYWEPVQNAEILSYDSMEKLIDVVNVDMNTSNKLNQMGNEK